jgi:glutathione S-transferase
MKLYFSPLACSMASRIAFYEAGTQPEFAQVDTKSKTFDGGADYYGVNPLGQVPVLLTDEGVLLMENSAILPFIADCFPQAELAPAARTERARMQQWLGFVGTELHKAVFSPLLDPHAPEEVKTFAQGKIKTRLDVLQKHLVSREFLLEHFTVADAYLFVVLNWSQFVGIELASWPAVQAYYQRLSQRPSVARALTEEMGIYQQAKRA